MNLEAMTIEEIWSRIGEKANEQPDLIAGLNATYSFKITGEDGGDFGVEFNEGVATIVKGGIGGADCTIIVSSDNFKKLIQGNINSAAAVMSGRIKIKGNVGLAMKLEELLKEFQ